MLLRHAQSPSSNFPPQIQQRLIILLCPLFVASRSSDEVLSCYRTPYSGELQHLLTDHCTIRGSSDRGRTTSPILCAAGDANRLLLHLSMRRAVAWFDLEEYEGRNGRSLGAVWCVTVWRGVTCPAGITRSTPRSGFRLPPGVHSGL